MDAIRRRGTLVLIGCFLLVMFPGCSGNSGDSENPQVDVSTLPAEEQVMQYAASGDLAKLKALIEADPGLAAVVDGDGRTPLHFAAGNDQSKVVKYLLEQGADPTALDNNDQTPADAARMEVHMGVAKMLDEAAQNAAGSGG